MACWALDSQQGTVPEWQCWYLECQLPSAQGKEVITAKCLFCLSADNNSSGFTSKPNFFNSMRGGTVKLNQTHFHCK